MEKAAAFQTAVEQFSDWRWRLNNLYYITDKAGSRVRFEMNWAQEQLYEEMFYLNIILKARQLGFTTFIQLFMLDACIFNHNVRAGVIAHTRDDAEAIFRDKIKFPYDNLPAQIRAAVPIVKDNTTTLELANNSLIRVGTSMRSGTLQYLHISEFGKVCAKYPEKAREIVTGALNTIQAGQIAWIESTAEGQDGRFFEMCQRAQTRARRGEKLTELDWKFFFFPWWKHPDYRLDPAGVAIGAEYRRYFDGLVSKHGIRLAPEQEAWYVKKAEDQDEDMKREYPSTPEEAFEGAVEGAYYGEQMAVADLKGRIGNFPWQPGIPVDTAWDIGVDDYTAIWFFQRTPREIHVIDYYENSGEGAPHYAGKLRKLSEERGYIYGDHWLPHDVKVREWGSARTRIEQLIDNGLKPSLVRDHSPADRINASRAILPHCWFDRERTSEGVKALKAYRKDFDEKMGVWKSEPRHDWACHAADGFGHYAMVYEDLRAAQPKPKEYDFEKQRLGDLIGDPTRRSPQVRIRA